MDFSLTMEQQMTRDMSRDFAENEIMPRARELDERAEFPYEIAEKMAELGMMGIPFPESYGGSGGDCISFHLCVEEISRGDVSLGVLLDVTCGVAEALYSFGTEEQKEKWLGPLVRGQAIGCFGLTEPDAGSDATAVKTKAVLDGDEWIINGSKTFITNAGLKNMSIMIAIAQTIRKENESPRINGFIIPRETPGLRIGRKLNKLGWRSSDTREVFFDDCRIPQENIFGEPDRGIAQALTVLHTARISMAAISVGLARACFDASLKYAKERKAFGKPISRFGRIQDKLANMALGIKLSQLIIYEASWRKDNKLDFVKEASYAKLFASEHAKYCADQGVQIHGGYGFMNEYDVSRFWREVKVNEIAEGTSEIQRLIIARELGCETFD
jgi:short/branched chain acyl-CoA dehydrogenase